MKVGKINWFKSIWCAGFKVMTPLFTHLSITFSYQRFSKCSPTRDVGFLKLMSDSFCGNRIFRWIFCSAVTCAAVISVIFLNSPSGCKMIYFCQCWFSPTVPHLHCCLPMIMYTDIILETVTLDTPNNMAVFVTDALAKHTPVLSFQMWQVFHFPIFWHGLTRSLLSVNKCKKCIQYCQLKFHQCSQQIIFLNFLVFPLLCPHLYISLGH
jgi:hypothetical protein